MVGAIMPSHDFWRDKVRGAETLAMPADRTEGELPLPRLAQLRDVHRRRRGIRRMDQAVEQDVNFFDKANH
jgi:hypothetical protein